MQISRPHRSRYLHFPCHLFNAALDFSWCLVNEACNLSAVLSGGKNSDLLRFYNVSFVGITRFGPEAQKLLFFGNLGLEMEGTYRVIAVVFFVLSGCLWLCQVIRKGTEVASFLLINVSSVAAVLGI